MTQSEQIAWDMYFASVSSMQFHPRATLNGAKVRTIVECAEIADQMMLERKKRQSNEQN